MRKENYIIVKDRHPHFSEVLWDCSSELCVPASKGESLSSILAKFCTTITNMKNQIGQMQTRIDELEDRVEELEA